MKKQVHALHGFLGRPADWDPVFPGDEAVKWDLFAPPFDCELTFLDWVNAFHSMIDTQNSTKRVLVGYSLGGRLALHCLCAAPEIWDAAILISANPGISSIEEKIERLERDIDWSEKFRTMDWESLIASWDSQAVFQNSSSPERRDEEDFPRYVLADKLIQWSLGNQEDLRQKITALNVPILWISGEYDVKYRKISTGLEFTHPDSRVWIAPKAGHRAHLDCPKALKREIDSFLNFQEEHDNVNAAVDTCNSISRH